MLRKKESFQDMIAMLSVGDKWEDNLRGSYSSTRSSYQKMTTSPYLKSPKKAAKFSSPVHRKATPSASFNGPFTPVGRKLNYASTGPEARVRRKSSKF
jgi:hypothetical protein